MAWKQPPNSQEHSKLSLTLDEWTIVKVSVRLHQCKMGHGLVLLSKGTDSGSPGFDKATDFNALFQLRTFNCRCWGLNHGPSACQALAFMQLRVGPRAWQAEVSRCYPYGLIAVTNNRKVFHFTGHLRTFSWRCWALQPGPSTCHTCATNTGS